MNRIDEKFFIPDFYIACSHGTGTLSFIYNLSWLGVLASNAEVYYENGKQHPLIFPNLKSGAVLRRAITCDRAILGQPLTYGNCKQKIIQLLRDPIDTICSMMNWHIASLVSRGNTLPINLSLINKRTYLSYINHVLNMTAMFTSIHNSIKSNGPTLYLNFNDMIRAYPSLLRKVANFLEIDYNNILDNISEIPYNKFSNRIWRWQPQLCFTDDKIYENLNHIFIHPEYIFDFWMNFWQKSHILETIEYNNVTYTISMPEKFFYERNSRFGDNLINDKIQKNIEEYIDMWLMHIELASNLYKKFSVSSQEILDLINQNIKYKKKFLRLMEYETSLPQKHAAHIVDEWKNFNSLF